MDVVERVRFAGIEAKSRRDRFGTIVEAGFWMAMEVVERQ
jgi:hypothetical protein